MFLGFEKCRSWACGFGLASGGFPQLDVPLLGIPIILIAVFWGSIGVFPCLGSS